MDLIARKNYPALNHILWDIKAENITAETAFHLYEKRWKYIDQQQLDDKEQALIQHLIATCGHGIFIPA